MLETSSVELVLPKSIEPILFLYYEGKKGFEEFSGYYPVTLEDEKVLPRSLYPINYGGIPWLKLKPDHLAIVEGSELEIAVSFEAQTRNIGPKTKEKGFA